MLAGVTDGSRSWFVGVGDALPGGARVERISPESRPVSGWRGWGFCPGRGIRRPAAAGAAREVRGFGAAPAPARTKRPLGRGVGGERPGPAPAAIAGKARAVDGDTLDFGGTRVRLWGIDAPESRQTCRAGGSEWTCGGLAAAALRSRSTDLRCEPRGRDRYGRVLAACFEGDDDVNAWLVSEGWALAYRRHSKAYVPA